MFSKQFTAAHFCVVTVTLFLELFSSNFANAGLVTVFISNKILLKHTTFVIINFNLTIFKPRQQSQAQQLTYLKVWLTGVSNPGEADFHFAFYQRTNGCQSQVSDRISGVRSQKQAIRTYCLGI